MCILIWALNYHAFHLFIIIMKIYKKISQKAKQFVKHTQYNNFHLNITQWKKKRTKIGI